MKSSTAVENGRSEALAHSRALGRAFDGTRSFWRAYYTAGTRASDPPGAERIRVFGSALAAIEARGLWLDVGCGIGAMTRRFRSTDLQICGADMSSELLDEARELTGLPLVDESDRPMSHEHLIRAAVERLPYPDSHFDGAYSSSVLEYTASLALALAELRRVVRTGGRLVFNLPNARSVLRRARALLKRSDPYYALAPEWAQRRSHLERTLEDTGWTLERFTYYDERSSRRFIAGLPWGAAFVLVVARAT